MLASTLSWPRRRPGLGARIALPPLPGFGFASTTLPGPGREKAAYEKAPGLATGGFPVFSVWASPHSAGVWFSPAIRRWPANILCSIRRPKPAMSSTMVNTAGM